MVSAAYEVLFWVTLVILLGVIGVAVYASLKVESELKTGFNQGCNTNLTWANANKAVANLSASPGILTLKTSFDPKMALALIYCNAMMAGTVCQSNQFVPPNGMKLVAYLNTEGESLGCVLSGSVLVDGTSQSVAIVSWRGTETLKDVDIDARETLVDYPLAPNSGKVHQGFLQAYQGARDQLLNVLGQL